MHAGDIVGDPQTYAIIGAAMEVHRTLKHGFLEAVYLDAMKLECAARGIPYTADVKLQVEYKGARDRRWRCSIAAEGLYSHASR